MPTKWLQERGNGSKNEAGITHVGPSVVQGPWTFVSLDSSPESHKEEQEERRGLAGNGAQGGLPYNPYTRDLTGLARALLRGRD